MRQAPDIISVTEVAKTRLFSIERVGLKFSNGVETAFERLCGVGGAVMVAAIEGEAADRRLVLIREYAVGPQRYELGFPKGRVDPGETGSFAANRELAEEAGFMAKRVESLGNVTVAPAYTNFTTELFVAEDLYEATAEGDEPEPPEVVLWPLGKMRDLLEQPEFTESRSRLVVYMLLERYG